MNAVHLDWRDGPTTPPASPGTPFARVLSIVVHAVAVFALTRIPVVHDTIVETFEQPRLVFVAPAPPSMTPPAALTKPDPAPQKRAPRPLQAEDPAPPIQRPAAQETAMPSLPTFVVPSADVSAIGSALVLDAPAFSAPASASRGGGGAGPSANTGRGSGGTDAVESQPVSPPVFDAAYLNNPRPAYPEAAVRRGVTGVVLLRVLVSVEGRAESVEVERSSGSRLLDDAAIATVKASWRFVPAKRGGAPVAATVIVPIKFELNGK